MTRSPQRQTVLWDAQPTLTDKRRHMTRIAFHQIAGIDQPGDIRARMGKRNRSSARAVQSEHILKQDANEYLFIPDDLIVREVARPARRRPKFRYTITPFHDSADKAPGSPPPIEKLAARSLSPSFDMPADIKRIDSFRKPVARSGFQ